MDLSKYSVSGRNEAPGLMLVKHAHTAISLTRHHVVLPVNIIDYLKMSFDDVTIENHTASGLAGYRAPTFDDIAALVAFARTIDDSKPVHIHCDAGVSRSPAALLIVLATKYGVGRLKSDLVAKRLLDIRPQMMPNKLMLKLADQVLGTGNQLQEVGQKFLTGIYSPTNLQLITHP